MAADASVDPCRLIETESATSSRVARTRIANTSGCFEINLLAAGSYTVTAATAGFVTSNGEDVRVVEGSASNLPDFVVCLGRHRTLDYAQPSGFDQMWESAAVVACVRITGTSPEVVAPCPSLDYIQTAEVTELLKPSSRQVGKTLTFSKESWDDEPTRYPAGLEMVVLLAATPKDIGG